MAVVRWLEDAVSALLTANADRSLAKVLLVFFAVLKKELCLINNQLEFHVTIESIAKF